jgi:hypothetical protein
LGAAVCPLVLAGYGGRLATLALPSKPREKRVALLIVWSLAIVGIVFFGISQWVAYESDGLKDKKDEQFKATVLEGLKKIIEEPDRSKQKQAATELRDIIEKPKLGPSISGAVTPASVPSSSESTEVADSLPSYKDEQNGGVYPDNFYTFVPLAWGFPTQNTGGLQREMIGKYQLQFRSNPPKPIKISYLQGDPSSYSLALLLERVYGNAGWIISLLPRTDIGHVTGLYVFQDSIENNIWA